MLRAQDGAPARHAPAAPLRVECVPADRLQAIIREWTDLCARALEDNVFLEPGFALPLLTRLPAGRQIVLVWEHGIHRRLVGLLPMAAPSRASPGLARGFDDEQAALGTPLLDRDRAAEVFAAILAALAARWPRVRGLVLARLPADGAVARLLVSHLVDRLAILDQSSRAVLHRPRDPASPPLVQASPKLRKEIRRQRRRLAAAGALAYDSASEPTAVSAAAETFLALEERGWKGARGTALLSDPRRAAFARASMRRMAEAGMCRIDTLLLDDEPIAMGVVLTVRGRAHWWKTAYDERFATLSPGVQFAASLTRRQNGDADVTLTDSCAGAENRMIARLWQGRMPLADFAVSLRPEADATFRRAVRVECCRRAVRAWSKARWLRLRRAIDKAGGIPISRP